MCVNSDCCCGIDVVFETGGKLMFDDCMQRIKEVLYWKNSVVHLTYACALALLAILHTRRVPWEPSCIPGLRMAFFMFVVCSKSGAVMK